MNIKGYFVSIFRKVKQWLQSLSFRTGVLFGLAKTFQYGGLTILGVEGYKRLKSKFKKKKVPDEAD